MAAIERGEVQAMDLDAEREARLAAERKAKLGRGARQAQTPVK